MRTQYSHISIQYAVLIKQFITQLVFAKFNQRIIEKTTHVLEYMTFTNKSGNEDPPESIITTRSNFEHVYQKILLDHIINDNDSRELWDETFEEHNINIVIRYFIDIINHLFAYSDNTNTSDPKYAYSQETIRYNLYCKSSRVIYPPNVFNIHSTGLFTDLFAFQEIEHEKQIRNSIIHDVLVYIIEKYGWWHLHICEYDAKTIHLHHMTFNPKPFYIYLGHYSRRLIQLDNIHILDENGRLFITESLLYKYHPITTIYKSTTYYEIYTVWLLYIWLQ